MKQFLLFFYLCFCINLISFSQPRQVAKWNYSGYLEYSFDKVEQDSLIAFVWPEVMFTFNVNTSSSKRVDIKNVGITGRPYLKKSNGNYFVQRRVVNGFNVDSLMFFDFNTLSVVNIGISGKSKTGDGITFLYTRTVDDTLYVMSNNIDKSYKVFKVFKSTKYDLDINLTYPIIGEFCASNDTFLLVVRYKAILADNVALLCKTASGFKTLYEDYADSVTINGLYIVNGKAYFDLYRMYPSRSAYYESNFSYLDAKPSSFDPKVLNSVYKGERMRDGTWRKMSNTRRAVERYDSSGLNLIRITNFPPDFNIIGEDRTVKGKGNTLWVSTSNDFGIEPCVLTDEDSFIRFDITPGMYSSYVDEYNVAKYSVVGDTIYTTIRNGLDENNYLYRINPKLNPPFEPITSLGKDSLLDEITYLFAYRDHLYYLSRNYANMVLTLYQIPVDLPALSVNHPSYTFDRPEWHKQLGNGMLGPDYAQINTGGVALVDSGSVIVSAFSQAYASQLSSSGYLLAYQENYKHKMSGGQFTAKLNANGKVVWIKSYGKLQDFYDINFHQVIDRNGDVYVTGQAGKVAVFGSDTLKVKSGTINFIVKLNGKTGDIIWHKMLFTGANYNSANIENLAIDSFNNLYLAITYTNFSINILGTSLSNKQVSPANALVKLNAEGSLIWAVNMITPFTKYYGLTRAMVVNHSLQKIVVVQSIGYYNWSSTCKYSKWYSYVQSIDLYTGKVSWNRLFESDDLHSTTSIALNKQGDLVLGGYYRGTIEFDQYKFSSKPVNNCSQFQPFFTVMSSLNGAVLFAQTSETDIFYPFEMKRDDEGNIWSVGARETKTSKYNLSLIKLNPYGEKQQELSIRKYGDPFEFDFFPCLDVNQSHVVFADAVISNFDTFPYCFPYGEQLSIVKLKRENIPTYQSQAVLERVEFTGYAVNIYPNPTRDKLMFLRDNSTNISSLSLSDLTGRTLLQIPYQPSALYQEIDLSYLPSGVYFLKIEGDMGEQYVKVVKME